MKSIGWILFFIATVAGGAYYVVQPGGHQDQIPEVVRVGVLPDVGVDTLRKRYDPFLKYLSSQTGYKFKLVLPSNYFELIHWLENDEIDLAYLDGLTFIQSSGRHHVKPLVMRDVDTRFTSFFLVRSDDPAQDIQDLQGKSFSFGSRLSTSGHMMPRYFMLKEKQLIPEQHFNQVLYSGAHDRTAYQVRDGEVDVGVANSEIIKTMFREGFLNKNDVRVIWETPPFSDYVWVVQEHLNQKVQTDIRDAFFKLEIENPMHKKILQGVGAMAFLPARKGDYEPLLEIASSLGLLVSESK